MIENFEKKRADKICNEFYDLSKKIDMLCREAESALGTESQSYIDCCDHEFNEYVKDQYWINNMEHIRRNLNNILIGFNNLEQEVDSLYGRFLESAFKNIEFPNIMQEYSQLKKDLREGGKIAREQKEYVKNFKRVFEMLDGEQHMALVERLAKKTLEDCKKIVYILNEYSVGLGNVDIDEQKQNRNELNSNIHLYALAYFDHHIEKDLFERLSNRQNIENHMSRMIELVNKNLKSFNPANEAIILASIQEPTQKNVIFFSRDFDAYLELLLCSAKKECRNGNRKIKLSRRQVSDLAQMLIDIEKRRQMDQLDEYNRTRLNLFTKTEEQGLNL